MFVEESTPGHFSSLVPRLSWVLVNASLQNLWKKDARSVVLTFTSASRAQYGLPDVVFSFAATVKETLPSLPTGCPEVRFATKGEKANMSETDAFRKKPDMRELMLNSTVQRILSHIAGIVVCQGASPQSVLQ